MSWQGIGHLVAAAVGFACLIGACVLFAGHFARRGPKVLSRWSAITAVVFTGGWVGIATGSTSSAIVLAFWIAVIAGWAWLAGLSVHLYRATPLLTPAQP